MQTRFTVVRYRPDALRDECRNIGLVAWSAGRWAERLIDGLPGEVAMQARWVMGNLGERIEELPAAERLDEAKIIAVLERQDGPYAQVLFRCDPGSSVVERPAELIDEIWEVFFGERGGEQYGRWVWKGGGGDE